MSKQTRNLFTILSKVFCLCFLFALVLTNTFFSDKANKINDLVYCPLQKIWIKKLDETFTVRKNSLDQICMSDTKKQSLAIQISFKTALAVDEKGIFETLKFGEKVLDNYKGFPNLPNQHLVNFRHYFSILNSKTDIQTDFQIITKTFSIQQFSRPPTLTKTTKFDFQIAQTLEKISRNINPRSPPIFS
jgi:hypothetical protein